MPPSHGDYVVCIDSLKPHGLILTRNSCTIESHLSGMENQNR